MKIEVSDIKFSHSVIFGVQILTFYYSIDGWSKYKFIVYDIDNPTNWTNNCIYYDKESQLGVLLQDKINSIIADYKNKTCLENYYDYK